MSKQEHAFKDTQPELDSLAKEIKLLSSEMRQDAWLSIITTADAVNRYLTLRLRRARFHSTRYGILNALVTRGDGDMTLTTLSKVVFRSKYNVSRVLDKLERDGLVERHASSSDRRIRKIVITPRGIDIMRESMPERREIANEVTSILSKDEMDILRNVLKRLRKHLNNLIAK